MSRCTDIRDICGDYAFDVEYHADNKFTMFFNSYRNAKTVKRCIEVDDSVPNVATAVDFVEVVRCKDCKHNPQNGGECDRSITHTSRDYVCEVNTYRYIGIDYCSYGERRDQNEG